VNHTPYCTTNLTTYFVSPDVSWLKRVVRISICLSYVGGSSVRSVLSYAWPIEDRPLYDHPYEFLESRYRRVVAHYPSGTHSMVAGTYGYCVRSKTSDGRRERLLELGYPRNVVAFLGPPAPNAFWGGRAYGLLGEGGWAKRKLILLSTKQ
jgi:hypothetical protein